MATAAAPSQKLNDGILALLKPAVEKVDAQVHRVRESQVCIVTGYLLNNQLISVKLSGQINLWSYIWEIYWSILFCQFELRKQIEAVTDELQKIGEEHHVDINLEPYIQRLINTKRRVVLVSNIVQNIQERLAKLHK